MVDMRYMLLAGIFCYTNNSELEYLKLKIAVY